jgi:hypothetical protein
VTKKTMDDVKSEETTGLNRDLQSTIEAVAGFSLWCPRFAARVVRMEFRWKEQHWDRIFCQDNSVCSWPCRFTNTSYSFILYTWGQNNVSPQQTREHL